MYVRERKIMDGESDRERGEERERKPGRRSRE